MSRDTSKDTCTRYVIPGGSLSYVDELGKSHSILLNPLEAYLELGCPNDERSISLPSHNVLFPYAWSTSPAVFALSGAAAVSWLLLVLLVISHRRRPFLQLWAVFFLSGVSTVLLCHMTSILENQYKSGYQDAMLLSTMMVFSWRFRLLFSLGLFFLWCAHLQVVLRLYNRKREKSLIKIIGGFFVVVDSCLWAMVLLLSKSYNFPWRLDGTDPPEIQDFSEANKILGKRSPDGVFDATAGDLFYPMYFPLLLTGVIFQIILHLGYGYLILVYTYRKRRYAYQKKCTLIIILSVLSFLVPLPLLLCLVIVFPVFLWCSLCILVAGAASTVVVWDWIDIIEYGEKEEQKLGVMGRQIFEGKDAKEYDKMSGTGGGNGVVPGRVLNAKRPRQVMITRKIKESGQFMRQIGKALLTSDTPDTLVRQKTSDSHHPEPLFREMEMEMEHHTSTNPLTEALGSPVLEVVGPGSGSGSPELRLVGTTQVDLSSPSPSAALGPAKKYAYPVKRARIRVKSRKGDTGDSSSGDGGSSSLPVSAVPADSVNTLLERSDNNSSSPAEASSSAAQGPQQTQQGDGEVDDLPRFEMIPGFSIRDYHDDKIPLTHDETANI